jgi:phasin family protein
MATTTRKTAKKTSSPAAKKSTGEATGRGRRRRPGRSQAVRRSRQARGEDQAARDRRRRDRRGAAQGHGGPRRGQQAGYEGIKALAQRRNEILQEALVEWQEAMRDATGKDALAKNAERAQRGVQRAIANFQELAEMEAKSRSKAWKIVQDRFQENLANLQKLLQPK